MSDIYLLFFALTTCNQCKFILIVKHVLSAGATVCTYGLKVHGTDGPSKVSNIVPVPLKEPTILYIDNRVVDNKGLNASQIANIVFGAIGVVTSIVAIIISIFQCRKKKEVYDVEGTLQRK